MIELRPLDIPRDAEDLHKIFGDPESCTWLTRPATQSVAETRALLEGWHVGCEKTEWAIVETPGGLCLGRVSMIPQSDAVYEVATTITPEARGRGVAYRGAALALDHIFDAAGARRVVADIDPDNTASIRLFERLGFQREGYLRETYETHIGVRDTVLMAMIRSDPRPWRD